MAKTLNPTDFLNGLDIDLAVDGCGELSNCYLRLCYTNVLDVSCVKKEFDRWANSTEHAFDLNLAKDQRRFKKCLDGNTFIF